MKAFDLIKGFEERKNKLYGEIEMAEPQSRYGIVNDLSAKKATLINEKAALDEQVLSQEKQLRRLTEDLQDMKKNVEARKNAIDEQIANYNEAIDAVKSISKEKGE